MNRYDPGGPPVAANPTGSTVVAEGPATGSTAPAQDLAPLVDAQSITFRLADHAHALSAVRLVQSAGVPGELLDFARTGPVWTLQLGWPNVQRLEYRVELRHPDGGVEEICDPANPLRVPGAFGDNSEVRRPGYQPPGWLDLPGVAGHSVTLTVPSRLLKAAVGVRLWSPHDAGPDEPLPLLVANDGPEYDRLAGLTRFSAALIAASRLPRHRVALLSPSDRNEWYSANLSYARALCLAVLPALGKRVRVSGPVVGMGTSLGGLAMLHAQLRHPGTLGALFLQSGSFFDRRLDPQERRFSRYARITRFVGETLRRSLPVEPVPVRLTCGTVEENLANNRQLAGALLAHGYPVELVEVLDAHNFVAWRDSFDPVLAGLLATVWG